jgi:arylsulfatase A-like enzyme
VSSALRGLVSLALWIWLAEVAFAVAASGTVAPSEWRGRLVALFVGAAWCGLVGFGASGLVRLASGPGDPDAGPWAVRAWAWCWGGAPAVRQARVATALATVSLVAIAGAAGFFAAHALVIGIARPHFAALAILGIYLVLAAVGALAWSVTRRASGRLVDRAARVPLLRTTLRSPGALLSCLAMVLVIALAAFALRSRASLGYLPWRTFGAFALGTGAAVAWSAAARRLPGGLGVAGRVAALLLVGAGAVVTAGTGSRDAAVRRDARLSVVGIAGYAATEAVLDFDRDGALGLLGGGDCAPFDARRGPGAVDVPNNGLDEDCDGADLGTGSLAALRARRDWPVPDAVPNRPPVVLVTIDTFAARAMGALGDRRKITPHLDAFAARSALFTHCFSQGPSTRLSFPSIFTSRFDTEIRQELVGSHPYPIAASEDLLAEVMQRAGYDTVAVAPDPYFGKHRWPSLTQGFRTVIDRPYATRPQPRHNGALVTDAAIEAVAARRKEPLFLWAHYYDAHSPHAQPEGVEPVGPGRQGIYEAELKYVDREVGRLLAAVATRLPDAVVVVTADHGIAFDEPRHERLNYGYDLYTSILHVPLIVHAPFVAPRRLDHLVSTIDIVPTLVNLLRVKGRAAFRGASLVPELLEGKARRPQTLLHQFFIEERLWKDEEPLEIVALRTPRFNLVHDRRVGAWEFYDWTRDYWERDDLSGRSDLAGTFDALKRQLALFTYETYRGRERGAKRAEVR